jgi:DNA-binding GntR family transcriptional regulator
MNMPLIESAATELSRASVRRPADSVLRAYAAIRAQVVDFRLKPGERVNEFQLARQLGLSRTPVREALNRLASEGFLMLTPNRGFFFRPLDIEALVQFYEVRGVLERGAFRLSCARATDAAIADLADFWTDAKLVYLRDDPDEKLDLDETFHLRLAALSGNPEFARQLGAINARIRFARRTEIARGPRHAIMVDDHAKLIAALQRRDAAMGCAILSEHITLSVEDARGVLQDVLGAQYAAAPAPAVA